MTLNPETVRTILTEKNRAYACEHEEYERLIRCSICGQLGMMKHNVITATTCEHLLVNQKVMP